MRAESLASLSLFGTDLNTLCFVAARDVADCLENHNHTLSCSSHLDELAIQQVLFCNQPCVSTAYRQQNSKLVKRLVCSQSISGV